MLDLALPAAAMPQVHTIGFDRVKPTSTLAAQNKMQSRSVRSAIRPPLLQWSAMQLSHELSGRRSSNDFRSASLVRVELMLYDDVPIQQHRITGSAG